MIGIVVFLAAATVALGLDNGLGKRPPLAYSTWNYFALDINESTVIEVAEAMAKTGLVDMWTRASGGSRPSLNIDAGYLERKRDARGQLVVNATKFPSGLAYVSERLAKVGLGLGVYTDITNASCGLGPGSLGHYKQDAD